MFNLTAQDFKNGTIVGYASKVFLGGLKPNTIYICSTNDTAQLGSSTTNLLFGGANSTANGVNISSPKTATSNENGEVEVLLRTTNIDNFLNNYWVQIEEGTTATSYVPHQEQNLPFTFSEGQRAMQGTTLEDDGIHNTWKQYTFTGQETFTIHNTYNDIKGFRFEISNLKANNGNVKSNNFIGVPVTEYNNLNRQYGRMSTVESSTTNHTLYITQPNAEVDSVEKLQTFFANRYTNNNPVIVEYELAESALENNIIPYNETQQAQYNVIKQARSYDDQTNISSTSDELGFNMDVESLANANKVIDNLDTRLLALESEV